VFITELKGSSLRLRKQSELYTVSVSNGCHGNLCLR
jgi:hypothetical protein